MLEISAVFDRRDRLHHNFGNCIVGHEPALGAVLVGKVGDQRWLQLVRLKLLAVVTGDLIDASVFKADGRAVRSMKRLRARMDGDAFRPFGIGSHRGGASVAIYRIARVSKLLRDRARRELLARPEFLRRCVHLRRVLEQRLFQPLIDNVRILDVVIAKDGRGNRKANYDYRSADQQQVAS